MKTDAELRELDAFVAGRVMGWNPVQSVHDLSSKEDFCVSGRERNCWVVDHGNNIKKFSPTTDPAAAMQVLERCVDVVTVSVKKQFDGSFCIWWTASEPIKENFVIGDTLPTAICLFARELFEK